MLGERSAGNRHATFDEAETGNTAAMLVRQSSTLLLSGQSNIELTEFQKSMFRAGHAHAGILVILSLIAQILIDYATLSKTWKWIVRICFPVSAILISGGFFAAAIGTNVTSPNSLIAILYVGIIFLLVSLAALGVGLIRKGKIT